MRVVLLAGGASIHTIRWADALSDAGLRVHLLTRHPLLEPVRDAVEVEHISAPGMIGYALMAPRVRRLVRRIAPDLVNAHYASGYGTTARLAKLHPLLLSVWGRDVYEVPDASRLHRRVVCGNLRAADRLASTSHSMRRRLRELVPEIDDVEITPFGVDVERFEAAAPESARSPEELVIGTVKMMQHKHGVDVLVRAFARLLELRRAAAGPALRLRLVGDGRERGRLEALVRELGIEARVSFAGRVAHARVPEALAGLDVYAALSRLDSESFGVAAIEASAAGLPVVVSDAGGLPEVVLDGRTGLVVPREDPEAAARALDRLVGDAELRHRLGTQGRRHVRAHYEWSTCVGGMITAYERTVDAARGAGA